MYVRTMTNYFNKGQGFGFYLGINVLLKTNICICTVNFDRSDFVFAWIY